MSKDLKKKNLKKKNKGKAKHKTVGSTKNNLKEKKIEFNWFPFFVLLLGKKDLKKMRTLVTFLKSWNKYYFISKHKKEGYSFKYQQLAPK